MTEVNIGTEDKKTKAYLQLREFGPKVRGELRMYLNGDETAVHLIGGQGTQSLYFPTGPLQVEVVSRG